MYKTELIKKEMVAYDTMAFSFKKPDGYVFKPGQSTDVTLINPPETDAEGNTRTFSVVSAPYETNVEIATRMRDTAFKRVLKSMQIGSAIEISEAGGSLILHSNISKPAVLLAGGIGITPFMSILRNAAHEKLGHKIFLFYSNRKPEDAAFIGELENIAKQNPNFTLAATMTQTEKSERKWTGETGYIDAEMLKRYVTELQGPIYYLAGPPSMVAAMRQTLNGAGILDDDIRSEDFSGY